MDWQQLTAALGLFVLGALSSWAIGALIKKRRARSIPAPAPQLQRFERAQQVLDPTKRKTLQPGQRLVPGGYRDAKPHEVVPLAMPALAVETPVAKPPPAMVSDAVRETERVAIEGRSLQHRFFGSQLIVGDVTVVRGLGQAVHNLEITPNGQLFIDNLPYKINPSDLQRVQSELAKTR